MNESYENDDSLKEKSKGVIPMLKRDSLAGGAPITQRDK